MDSHWKYKTLFYHSSSPINEKILQSFESTFESRIQTILESAPGKFLLVFLIWFQGDLLESRTENFLVFLSWNIWNSTLCKILYVIFWFIFGRISTWHWQGQHPASPFPAASSQQWQVCTTVFPVFIRIVKYFKKVFGNILNCWICYYFVFFFWYVVAGECE